MSIVNSLVDDIRQIIVLAFLVYIAIAVTTQLLG